MLYMPLRPMLAKNSREAFDSPDYYFEIKWDGFRTLCFKSGSFLRLQSRNLHDVTYNYPELHWLAALPHDFILDGELVVLKEGRPDFQALKNRTSQEIPVNYIIFDLLYWKYKYITKEPLEKRRAILEKNFTFKKNLLLSAKIPEKGKKLALATKKMGLEGIMAKRKQSPYLPGHRSSLWLKFRHLREEVFLIGGLTARPLQLISSLLLGKIFQGKIIYVGAVSSGVTDTCRQKILKTIPGIEIPPFANPPHFRNRTVTWLKPVLACRILFLEYTRDLKVRQPVFLGLDEHPDYSRCTLQTEIG